MLQLINYLILNKEEYTKYSSFIDKSIIKEDKSVQELFLVMRKLFEEFPEREGFTRAEFVAFARAKAADNVLIDVVETQDIGDDVLKHLVQDAKQRSIAHDLSLLAIDVSEGRKDVASLLTKVSEFDTIDATEEIEFVTTDLEQLYDHNITKPGLRWRLQTLNEMLGSLRKGDFGFIFARPESGKTTFLASECSFFAQQTQSTILWFNNEEQGEKVQLRCYQAALGLDQTTLFKDIAKNAEVYQHLTNNNIKIVDNASIYRSEVDRIVKQVQPALIVFDQIDKVKGFTADREDLRLGSIYQWARELAKTYCPVIAVCQSDGSGEGKKWLTMENVANAKTSKQAEADWILGIGKTNDLGMEYVRHLHLSKNKLSGDECTIPALRHGRRDVIIQPEIARFIDIA